MKDRRSEEDGPTVYECGARGVGWRIVIHRVLIIGAELAGVAVLLHLRHVVAALAGLVLMAAWQPKCRVVLTERGLELRWLAIRTVTDWKDVVSANLRYEEGINPIFGFPPRPELHVQLRHGCIVLYASKGTTEGLALEIRTRLAGVVG